MSQKELSVERRTTSGKIAAGQMRRAGRLPAVLYGHGETPVSLSVNAKEFSDLIAHAGVHSLLVLKGEGDETAIIKTIARHPVKGIPATVDFQRVNRNEKITVKVPLTLENEPVDVKSGDGLLVQSLHEIEVSVLPAEVPVSIAVDVSGLVLNGPALHVSEITLPAGVELLTGADEAVAAVNLPHATDLDAPMDELDAQIEAEGQEKAEAADASHAQNATVAEEVTAAAAQGVEAAHGSPPDSGGEGNHDGTGGNHSAN
jgi:large subunit ribosomal protein L25